MGYSKFSVSFDSAFDEDSVDFESHGDAIEFARDMCRIKLTNVFWVLDKDSGDVSCFQAFPLKLI